jgi:Glycosyl transferases group 1
MRLFQNSGLMAAYKARLRAMTSPADSFASQLAVFLNDRYGAPHILKPVYDHSPDAFFTNADDEWLQQAWARENGLPASAAPADILLAQIEHHRTEVFYNLDPVLYDAAFLKRLPAHVKQTIAWRAVPGKVDFTGYDLVVCNFPEIMKGFQATAKRTALFYPSHDPVLEEYAANRDRSIDVLFIGGYSRHHQNRARMLENVAGLSGRLNVVLCLVNSRYTRLAETPLGLFGPLASSRRPKSIRAIARPPVFGRDMYELLGKAKIIFNAGIDASGPDRGNMRCYEAMGAAAALVTDKGAYPKGMEDGKTMLTYNGPDDVCDVITGALQSGQWRSLAEQGHAMISDLYSKDAQYRDFTTLAG